jgi:ligand-binding sensor domain-containing protein
VPAFCQQKLSYNFRHIDRTNGLLHNQVVTIAQDNKGYVWIGTGKGLQRYDGLRFKNYDSDTGSIGIRPAIENVYAAGHYLWVTTPRGTEKLDINTNRVVRHFICGQTTADVSSGYDSYTGWDGTKYLVNDFEVYKYDLQNQKMTLYMVNTALPSATSHIAKDESKKQAWLISPQGLLLADAATQKIYSVTHNEINHPLLLAMKGKSASGIMTDSRHNTWIASRYNDQLYKFDPFTQKLFVYSLINVKKAQGEEVSRGTLYNNCIFEDNHGNIWVATQQAGLLKYNRQQDNFDYVLAAKNDNQNIEYNYDINCIFQDNQENIWLGTDKGINVFNPYKDYFQTIQHRKNKAASLPQNEVAGFIQAPSGDILIATWGGGISIYDSALTFKKNISFTGEYEKNLLWCFVQKDDKNIWAGCQHGFLHNYNTATGEITTIHPAAFEQSTIRCMQKDREGNAWFGLNNGKIAKWDKQSNQFLAYGGDAANTGGRLAPVYNIFIDSSNHFWAGTEEGLKQFDPVRRVYTATYHSTTVQGIEEYNDSTLLVGTVDDGLVFFNKKRQCFTHTTAPGGLPPGAVYAKKKDPAGNVWLTTDYNLYTFSPGKKDGIAYAIGPDIINSSFESVQFYPMHDGRWITATSTELFLFHPDSLSHSNEKPAIAITGFKLFDHPVFIDSVLDAGQPVPLTYSQNFITIEFSDLTFLDVRRPGYYYRLSGVDKDWVNANGNGYASYTNLAPGKYTFSVKAANAGNAPVTYMAITITPPWYKTWWFIFICIAAVGFLVYRWLKMREKNIKNRTLERANAQAIIQQAQMQLDTQQYKMAEAEMNALRAQMNPHFLFNSLNSINNYILKNDADNAAGYLTKFSRLMRLILDNSRSNWVWLQNELKALQLYVELEAFRFDNSFTWKINIDDNVNAGHIMVPPMIVQPYMENAIWHGLMHKKAGGGHLQIDVYREEDNLCITIKDNGVGREAANRMRSRFADNQKSYGMKITSERLEIMNKVYDINATVTVADGTENGGDETGTIVRVKFKYSLKNEPAGT